MSKLELLYSKKDEIPEEYASLYEEIDGKWKFTGIEGVKTQADIEAVMTAKQHEVDNRKTVEKELAEIKKKFDGIDPEKAREILQKLEHDDLKKKNPDIDLDKVKLQKDLDARQKELEAVNEEVNKLKAEKKDAKIKGELRKTARDLNFDPRFDDDIELRASFFDTTESGEVMTKDGKTVIEFLQPFSEKYSLPSNGSGERSHSGAGAGNQDQAKVYADAKNKGDIKTMMLTAPPVPKKT